MFIRLATEQKYKWYLNKYDETEEGDADVDQGVQGWLVEPEEAWIAVEGVTWVWTSFHT